MVDSNITLSALHDDHQIGIFGDYENKDKQDLVRIK